MSAAITVTVHKWEQHNGNKKRGHRGILVDTSLRNHPKMILATPKARLLYLWLLMKCGDDMTATIQFLPKQCSDWCDFGSHVARACRAAVLSLEENQLLTIENPSVLIVEKRKEKKPDEERKAKSGPPPASPEFDFEILYEKYPRKEGKDLGMRRLRARDWNQDTYDGFSRAVRKYGSECRLQRIDPKYIKHWSTFVGTLENEPWRDYSERPRTMAPPTAPMPINEPEFEPVDISTIKNPQALKLLNLISKKEPIAALERETV